MAITGRPPIYTDATRERVLERLSLGDLLVDICADDGMPSLMQIHRWRDEDETFRDRYARAREMQAHAAAERAVKSGRAATAESAAAARVRFDADRWLAGKLAPRIYGDKTMITGGDGEGPVKIEDTRPGFDEFLKGWKAKQETPD